MQTGLTIAFICKGEMHPTVANYHKFGKKYWDDGPKTFSKIGYYFAYYFQKERVLIHQIIDIVQPADRPASMDWDSDRQILCLSDQLKEFTWEEWIHGPGKGAPYSIGKYSNAQTTAWSYSTLQTKFSDFQFIQFKDIVEKMELLRLAKCNELQALIEEVEERMKSLTHQQLEYRSGKRDKELV